MLMQMRTLKPLAHRDVKSVQAAEACHCTASHTERELRFRAVLGLQANLEAHRVRVRTSVMNDE
jgi:hypothetical protein